MSDEAGLNMHMLEPVDYNALLAVLAELKSPVDLGAADQAVPSAST